VSALTQPVPMDNFADARGGNLKIKSQPIDGEPKGLSEVLKQDFTRVNRGEQLARFGHGDASYLLVRFPR